MTELLQLLCNRWGGDAGCGPGAPTPETVGRLTPYQINKIYFPRRGEHGQLLIAERDDGGEGGGPTDARSAFATYCRLNGITEAWRVEELWRREKGAILGEGRQADW